jgi:hypothetical protein
MQIPFEIELNLQFSYLFILLIHVSSTAVEHPVIVIVTIAKMLDLSNSIVDPIDYSLCVIDADALI